MCGITGFISNNLHEEELIKMSNALSHRGPNAEGLYFNKKFGVGLGHKRLSIIDLNSEANQPMQSHCGRYTMVYNGEVYNYKEIAKNLNEVKWKTNSDSEVILAAFSKWKFDFVNELNGMFAIAIYDQLENSLYLVRDRIGIKPLYYYYKENDLIFASEIKAFKSLNLKLSVNNCAIYSYLHLGYLPKDLTIYDEINKVKPGHILKFQNNKKIETSYWETENFIDKKIFSDFNQTKKKLKNLIHESVEKRLISDVPLGTFLSGGTDSSIVSAVAQKINNQPINTFSIGFEEAKYNESQHAKKVAEYLGTNHTEFILSKKEAINELENIIEHMDEPFADSSVLPTMMVSKMARKHVTVCLSGDGGDEQFLGYGAYNWAKRLNKPIFWNLRQPISKALSLSLNNKKKRAALVFNCPNKNWKSHIFSQEQYLFSEAEIKKILKVTANSEIINQMNLDTEKKRNLYPDESQALFDLNNYLVDDLLVKVDRSSMYFSLECRVPLLDHNIVEFSLNIDRKLKYKNGNQKYILKEILYDYIPHKLMERPKWGFSIPLEKWLKKELNYLIDKFLNKSIIEEYNILSYNEVKLLINRFYLGENYLYNRLWSLIVLNMFLKKIL